MKMMQMITEVVFGSAMKKTFIIASMIIMAAVAAGCSQEKLEPENSAEKDNGNEKITLTVSAVTKSSEVNTDDPKTKVAFGSTDATWETGDKIYLIKSDGTTITLTISGGIGTSSGTFVSSDPVTAGTYIPYAVSASSLTEGFVSVSAGVISLNLTNPGGSTLADVLKHDILKGDAVVLTNDQTSATITGLTTHILSFIRITFNSAAKGIESIGLDSSGGLYQTVTIAANGSVTGSNTTTGAVYTVASDAGSNNYAGYFAVYQQTTTSLMAHAFDIDNKSYTRLVSTKTANYTAGTVYGKSFTLSDAMVNSGYTGTLTGQNWKDLGLSVRWAEFNVGSSSEYSYDRNVDNRVSGAGGRDTYGVPAYSCAAIPAEWEGWRLPSYAEVEELFYASNREWITGDHNGVKFNCNDNYIAMGAGGRQERYHNSESWTLYDEGSVVNFYYNGTAEYHDWTGGVVRVWIKISNSGNTLGWQWNGCESRDYWIYWQSAMRLVCDF